MNTFSYATYTNLFFQKILVKSVTLHVTVGKWILPIVYNVDNVTAK